jgi:hypothetical protein
MPLNDDVNDEFSAKIEDENVFRGPIEIGAADRPDSEIGVATMLDRGSGSYAEDGPTEIGAADRDEVEIGSYAMFGPTEIGRAARGASVLGGPYAVDGASEIGGPFAVDGASEIGGSFAESGASEIGAAAAADRPGTEIGAAAIMRVVAKARDNRQPPPPMQAVDVDAPADDEDFGLTDVMLGVAAATGDPDPFPLTSKFMQRAGAVTTPRIVRVDTEQSYRAFRTDSSPELSELRDRVDELAARLDRHITDPDAHSAVADDIAEITEIGAAAEQAQADKRIELWMPKRFDGLVEAWRQGDHVCVSLALPGADGEIRVCTSMEPIRKCIAEMARHAAEADVPAATVVGVLPAMGCVLGAGTVIKEMAAAAPSILQRPEAAQAAPFVVRIEPRSNPALTALAMLVTACRNGDPQACAEWGKLGDLAPPPVKQAMGEAIQIVKSATK